MTARSISTLSLVSLLGLACGSSDPDATSTLSSTDPTNDPSNDDDDSESSPTEGSGTNISGATPATTTSGAEAGQTDTGDTTADVTITSGEPQTTEPETTDTPPETTTTTTEPGTTTTTEPGGTTTTGGETTTTGDDTTTSDDTTGEPPPPACQAPATQPPCDAGTTDIFKAIGLNCSDDKSMAIPIKNPVITSPDATAYRVTTHFGSAKDPMDNTLYQWGPKEGERLLAIGTGLFPALQNDGGLIETNGQDSQGNGNPDGLQDLPGIMTWEMGSNGGLGGTPFMNCDGIKDCSDTIDPQWNLSMLGDANDVFYMSFDLEVPVGTYGYLLDFAYFSEEWPIFVNSSFNDMLVVWSTSESFTGNVTFIEGQPLTVTALDPYMTIQPGNALLAGTGFPGDGEGAATGWFSAKGSSVPGESFTVAITVFDMGDTGWDTVGLIDKFRWDCTGCIPSEVDSCGVMPQ